MTDKNDLTNYQVPCEVYSRIVGYLRPVNGWNEAQRQQFEDRVVIDVKNVTDSVTKGENDEEESDC